MTTIPEFFKNQNVFVTGGTGFLGKALLEKLLRSCPDVGNIYVLMRKKKGKEITQRVRDITDIPLFDVLKRTHPDNVKKIVPLLGDCKELGLGLSPTDRQLIEEKVSVVFHCAATIRFDDTLTNSIILNVRGTREVMLLARNMKELKVVVHVSTIFSNCNRRVTDEVLYPTTIDWKEIIDVVENIGDSTIDALTKKIIGTFPNTYVYSKSLAENVVKDLGVNLPTVIVRPSMVFTSLSDPFPGWLDSWGGPVALSVGAAKGIIRNCIANPNAVMDIIPIDTVTKIICSAARERALCGHRMESSVYNACSYSLKKLTWGTYAQMCLNMADENPLDDILWIPRVTMTQNVLLFWLMTILFQVFPSAVLHGILKLKGTKSPLLYVQRKSYLGALGVRYFSRQSWEFKNKNVQELRKNLLPADRKEFDMDDFESVNFKQYLNDAYRGTRLHLMKQPAYTTPEGWKHFRRESFASSTMAPNVTTSPAEVSCTSDTTLLSSNKLKSDATKPSLKYRRQFVWPNVVMHAYLNLAALYGVYLMLTSAKVLTGIWAFILYEGGILGITAGAHRLWSHRAYKAKWPMRLFLMLLHTLAFQTSVHEWVRNHRVHHKNSDTDADPHNVHRGFFFTHYGWMLLRKHPAVKEKGKLIDTSDLDTDPLLIFQKRYYFIIMPILCFLIPSAVPVYFWGDTWTNAYHIAAVLRQVVTLHMTLITNSVTHWPGTWKKRPYDKDICPSENFLVSLLTLGEGWHNFHHVFPWDYKTSEIGNNRINPTTHFIDFCARIGWAYDLKTVPMSLVRKRIERTGDGTHEIWGWGDTDMTIKDRNLAEVINKEVM